MNTEKIKQAAEILSKAKNIVGFTGAGTSAESGIPPFRGEGGIWNQYDPNSLDIDFYYRHTKESWKIIREVFYNFFSNKDIKPNLGHLVLAKWEKEGRLSSVITQNIDDLHTVAGNTVVYEFHGNMSRFVCTKCGHKVDAKSLTLTEEPPAAENCDAFVIIGTSGQVSPANMIPGIAKRNGAKIIEINMEPSTYTNYITDIFLEGKSGEILPAIDALMTR